LIQGNELRGGHKENQENKAVKKEKRIAPEDYYRVLKENKEIQENLRAKSKIRMAH